MKLTSAQYITHPLPVFELSVEYVDYDGKSFCRAPSMIYIFKFEGSMKINELGAFPLSFHPQKGAIRKTLIERGKKFQGYKGRHNMEYKGIGLGETVRGKRVQYNVCGLIEILKRH